MITLILIPKCSKLISGLGCVIELLKSSTLVTSAKHFDIQRLCLKLAFFNYHSITTSYDMIQLLKFLHKMYVAAWHDIDWA